MIIDTLLKQLGFSNKEIQIYLALIKLGPSSVRKLAQETKINRGTCYDTLKSLISQSLVSYYHKEKHQYFVAEDPEKLKDILGEKQKSLSQIQNKIAKIIPELKSLQNKAGQKPVVKFYEGLKGLKTILQDLLQIMKNHPGEYFVYSSAGIRKYLFKAFPEFTKLRIKQKTKVKVIAIGPGGKLKGLDQRKWLTRKESSPTYILIYHNKIALISVNSNNNPLGVIVEDKGIYNTEKLIFKSLWNNLK